MSPSLLGLIVLVAASIAAVGYRKFITREEDDLIHVGEGSVQLTAKQQEMAKTIERLDLVVKGVIAVTVIYALAIGAFAIMSALNNTSAPS